jgi:hypothetical protein
MGLLDDAIREHLELKRRRGADSEEVSRQEHEALGPPQRAEFADAAPAAAEPMAPAEPPEAHEPLEPEPLEPEPLEPEPLEPEPFDREPLEEPRDQPTVEYVPEHEREGDADDVLEETPDFLQETPEHDRLWFEQKPPRDFDLDR